LEGRKIEEVWGFEGTLRRWKNEVECSWTGWVAYATYETEGGKYAVLGRTLFFEMSLVWENLKRLGRF